VGLRRLLLGRVDHVIRQTVHEVSLARIDDISAQIEAVRRETVEVRRIVTDDLDAANESAALLGSALASIADSLESLRSEVSALEARLDA
jgi:hypothetical protein